MGRERALFIGFTLLLGAAAIRLPVLEDEAYYWTWSRRLALHYYDHPPLIAWLIRAAEALTNDRWAALRLVSVSCMAITAIAVVATARRLVLLPTRPEPAVAGLASNIEALSASGVGRQARRLAGGFAGWGLASSLLTTVALVPCTPDPPLAAALALSAYGLSRVGGVPAAAASEGRAPPSGWMVFTGVSVAVAILCKLSAVLVAGGFVVGASMTALGRRRLWSRPVAVAVAITVAIVGAWWLSAPSVPAAFSFQAKRVFGGSSRWLEAVPMTLGGVLLVIGPALTLGTIAGLRRIDPRAPDRIDPRAPDRIDPRAPDRIDPRAPDRIGYRATEDRQSLKAGGDGRLSPAEAALLGGTIALFVGCFIAVGLGSGELNWLLPAAVLSAPFVAARAVGTAWQGRFVRLCQVQAILVAAVLVHIVRPVWPISAPRDRTLRSAGWREVASTAEVDARVSGASRLVTDGYQRASLLRFYLDDRWPVYEWGRRRRSQYDVWPRPSLCEGQTVIVVGPLREPLSREGVQLRRLAAPESVLRVRAGRIIESVSVQRMTVASSPACAAAEDEQEQP